MTAPVQILSVEEVVARCAINPRFLYPKDNRFDYVYLLGFTKPKGSSTFVTSVGWRELLPQDEDVHAYGCRSAASSNATKEPPPPPLNGAAHYIGFYGLRVGDGVDESNDVYDVHVEQLVENGECAHCHIVLTERENLTKDQQKLKSAKRSDIFYGIWEKMSGPSRHVCECDGDYTDQLESIELPPPGTPNDHGTFG